MKKSLTTVMFRGTKAQEEAKAIIGSSKESFEFYSAELARVKDETVKFKATIQELCKGQLSLLDGMPEFIAAVNAVAEQVSIDEEVVIDEIAEEIPEISFDTDAVEEVETAEEEIVEVVEETIEEDDYEEEIILPNVIGSDYEEAVARLEELGFVCKKNEISQGNHRENEIVSMSPSYEKAYPPGTTVYLIVYTPETELVTVKGAITDIRTAVMNGESVYFLELDGKGIYYSIKASDDEMVVIMSKGDSVTITHEESTAKIIDIVTIK